jgi:FdhE protein
LKSSWDLRIERAGELSQKHPVMSDLLMFYAHVARFQKSVYEKIGHEQDHSMTVLLPFCAPLLSLMEQAGSTSLKQAAEAMARISTEDWRELLSSVWQHEPEAAEVAPEFLLFAKILLQPYAEFLAHTSTPPAENILSAVCPFCGAKPQVAVMRPEGDGGKRSLICSVCATEWNFRRLVCPGCGEEKKENLPVFIAEGIDYVRIDACDTCKTYIKSIDMTKDGRAVPVVDELATTSLNLWAQEKNYQKVEPNLFGV